MTALQSIKFQRNEDISSVAVKRLSQNPEDKYPTLTFCFENYGWQNACENGIFDKVVVENVLNLTYCQFLKILNGDDGEFKDFDLTNLTRFNFVSTAMQFDQIFTLVEASTIDGIERTWNNTMNHHNDEKLPMYLSYLEPTQICFSRKADFNIGSFLENEDIHINKTYLRTRTHGYLRVKVYMHYSRQVIRCLKFIDVVRLIKRFDADEFRTVTVSQLIVLRRRNKPTTPCIQDIEGHDKYLMETVMRHAGCIPPYSVSYTHLTLPTNREV